MATSACTPLGSLSSSLSRCLLTQVCHTLPAPQADLAPGAGRWGKAVPSSGWGEITSKQEIHGGPESSCCPSTYLWTATGTWQAFVRQTEEAGGIDSSQKHHTGSNIHKITLLETYSGKTAVLLGLECLQTVPPPSPHPHRGWLLLEARATKARRDKGAGSP